MTTEYEKLRSEGKIGGRARGRAAQFTPEVAEARKKEQQRRVSSATSRAFAVLRVKYQDEYRNLYDSELAAITADLGPLPGDASSPTE
jgi:hypothetical protein